MKRKLSKPKAFIFDNDGVVVDSEGIIFEAAQAAFREVGIDLKPEDVEEGIGAGNKYITDPISKYNLNVPASKIIERRAFHYRRLIPGRLAVNDGFFTLHRAIQAEGIMTALASSASMADVIVNLKTAEVGMDLFNVIVNGDLIEHKKPAPDLFLKASDGLNINAQECLVIEDAPAGVLAAKRAGMQVVALAGSVDASKLQEADLVISSLHELLDTKERLNPSIFS